MFGGKLGLGAWALLAWAWAAPAEASPATLTGLSREGLQRLAAQVGSANAETRASTVQALSSLQQESLPALAHRLASLRGRRPPVSATKAALTAFRRALGSRNAEDRVDIARGIPAVLREDHSAATALAAEVVLYLRALEQLRGAMAGELMAAILLLDEPGTWDFELRLSRERRGLALLPTWIRLRSHEEGRVRSFAQAGVRALGMEDPLIATGVPDARLAAEVVLAYGEPLDFTAMPILVRLTAAEPLQVKHAARATVARFGKNAIWKLRELYAEVAGKPAEKAWDAERVARELYAVLDRDRTAGSRALLDEGLREFVDGDLDAMRTAFDRLLALDPSFGQRDKLAPGYAALGALRLSQDRLPEARDAYARAVRLAPSAPEAKQHAAQLAFVDAELALSSGVVDLDGYRRALELDPDHTAAAGVLDRLSGEASARARRHKRWAALAASLLTVLVALLLLRGRRPSMQPRAATS
jgi:tetratricopeptide (TPR) repeat protein